MFNEREESIRAIGSTEVQRPNIIDQISERQNRFEEDVRKLKRAKEILQKNPELKELELKELLDILRAVHIY